MKDRIAATDIRLVESNVTMRNSLRKGSAIYRCFGSKRELLRQFESLAKSIQCSNLVEAY